MTQALRVNRDKDQYFGTASKYEPCGTRVPYCPPGFFVSTDDAAGCSIATVMSNPFRPACCVQCQLQCPAGTMRASTWQTCPGFTAYDTLKGVCATATTGRTFYSFAFIKSPSTASWGYLIRLIELLSSSSPPPPLPPPLVGPVRFTRGYRGYRDSELCLPLQLPLVINSSSSSSDSVLVPSQ